MLDIKSAEMYIRAQKEIKQRRGIMPTRGSVTTVFARDNFGDIINRVAFGKERVSLTRRNKTLVAIVPIEDVEVLEKMEMLQDIEDAKSALKEATKKGTVSLEELRKELGL